MEAFIPLAFLGLILALYVFGFKTFKKRHGPETAGPQGQKPYGVHGWLAFFIFVSYYVAPLFTLGQVNSRFLSAERENEFLTQFEPWQTYKVATWVLLLVVVVWQIHLAHRLRWTWTPSSLTYARWFAFVMPWAIVLTDIGLTISLFGQADKSATVSSVIFAWGSSCIWGFYFLLSRRCKNTYLSQKGESVTTSEASVPPPRPEAPSPMFQQEAAAPVSPAPAAPTVSSLAMGSPDSTDQQPTDPAERLKKLNMLRASGLLTDSEYEAKRQEILGSI